VRGYGLAPARTEQRQNGTMDAPETQYVSVGDATDGWISGVHRRIDV
jgi:hypothetical protein